MPVYKDKKRGTWFCKYSVTANGEHRQIIKRGFPTKRDAVLWEAEQKRSPVKFTSKTFATIMEEMLNASDANEATKQHKRRWIQRHFPFVSERIEDINRQQLMEWRNALKSSNLASRTINSGIGIVKAVFTYASKIYGIDNTANILDYFKLTKEDKKEMSIWTPQQFEQFIEHCDPAYVPFFTFLYWTGCRRGEALALCREDVIGNKVHIHRSIKHFSNGFKPLKNDASERTITIDDKTLSLLDLDHANPFVFGETRSLAITVVHKVFNKAIKDAGLPKIRIHDLRHSHATLLINNGVNIVAISKRLGHADINMTLKVYSHLLQKSDDEMMEIIGKLR